MQALNDAVSAYHRALEVDTREQLPQAGRRRRTIWEMRSAIWLSGATGQLGCKR